MQTLYYSTSNWIRHTDNIVDLEQYRRKLSKAEDSQTEETSAAPVRRSAGPPQPAGTPARSVFGRLCQHGDPGNDPHLCPAGAGGLTWRKIQFSRILPAALDQMGLLKTP